MSNQEPAVVEEATEAEVEEQPQTDASDSPSEEEVTTQESPQPAADTSTHASEEPEQVSSAGQPQPAAETDEATSDNDDLSIHTLQPGQHFVGTVKNITNFGAFVDIGIPQDGLVHISKLSRRKVDKVTDVVSEGQEVEVWVKKVDKRRGRISLTMVKPIKRKLKSIKEGDEFEGTVTRLESYGAFVDIDSDRDGLVHISQITHDYIDKPEEALAVGDRINVKVLKVNRKKRQVDLSIKALVPPPAQAKEEAKKEEAVEAAAEELVPEEEATPTAMALAYAAFQYGDESEDGDEGDQGAQDKTKHKQEMDAIIARTLASRDD